MLAHMPFYTSYTSYALVQIWRLISLQKVILLLPLYSVLIRDLFFQFQELFFKFSHLFLINFTVLAYVLLHHIFEELVEKLQLVMTFVAFAPRLDQIFLRNRCRLKESISKLRSQSDLFDFAAFRISAICLFALLAPLGIRIRWVFGGHGHLA